MTQDQNPPATAPASSDELDRFLSAQRKQGQLSTSDYVEQGSALVTQAAIDHLRGLLVFIHEKVAAIKESRRLAVRIQLLTTFFEEFSLPAAPVLTPARRETTFALWYFLKGFDQIPDSIPEIGLLDDALIVEVVLRRNEAEYRDHWARLGRAWPAEA